MTEWYWVSLPYATFGIGVVDGRITYAPPIARWTMRKPVHEVLAYYRRRGATIERLSRP